MSVIGKWELREVFDDIILGRGVKRYIHDLEYDHNIYAELFIERLQVNRFRPVPVKDIRIEVGLRLPAFYIQGRTAIFGHVFWEVFSDHKKRKIWGSVVRNEKGDWKYILPGISNKIVFANLNQREEIDIYHLT